MTKVRAFWQKIVAFFNSDVVFFNNEPQCKRYDDCHDLFFDDIKVVKNTEPVVEPVVEPVQPFGGHYGDSLIEEPTNISVIQPVGEQFGGHYGDSFVEQAVVKTPKAKRVPKAKTEKAPKTPKVVGQAKKPSEKGPRSPSKKPKSITLKKVL